MKKATHSTPDLLSPVQSALKELEPSALQQIATDLDVSGQSLKNIRDGKFGPLGPSYGIVSRLHDKLVAVARK